jgi:hypothetical protein
MTRDASSDPQQSASDLVVDLLAGLSRLVKGEIALARAEATRSLHDATGALVAGVVAVVLGITALNVLSGAAVAALVLMGLTPLWAGVAVGVILLVVAVGLVQLARQKMSLSNLAPKRSMTSLRRDAETLKSMVTPGATSDFRP